MNIHKSLIFQQRKLLSTAAVILALVFSIALSACSSGSSGTGSNPTPSPTAKTVVQVNVGDSPADWMLAFSMNVTSMSLTGSNGSVSVVSSSVPMEMMHLMGVMQPLSMINAPQGTYTGALITIGSATVMYMDPTTKQPTQKTITGPMNAAVTFSSPMTLGTTPRAMGFDLDLASSVATDANGNLTMNPVFHMSSGMQGAGNAADFANGGIQQMMGSVSSISGSSFVMSSMQAAQNFTFMTNSSTVFNGTSMSGMAGGMLVMVDATLQSDGLLMATTVQSMMNSGGVMGGGIVTAVTGQPPTSLTLVMQNGVGTGMMSSSFAAGVTVDLNGSTTYQIDEDGVDMAGLSFTPVFDASHIYVGQSVMPISSSGMMSGGSGMMGGGSMGGTITASEVALEPQGMTGTISTAVTSGASTSFTLTLPSDSAFTTLTGATSVTVIQQPQTTVAGTSPIASGSSMHAFGLLFFDAGQWKMVAARMGVN
jgi:Domain of unknown function (DUF5666)